MSYIQTITGRKIDFRDPDPMQINILDIATGLARAPRFAGHTVRPWSVAAHSMFVADHCPPDLRFEGLMHDATEAYMCDVPSPLKALCRDYRDYERRLDMAIRVKYGLRWATPNGVHLVDQWALEEEGRAFCPRRTWAQPSPAAIENTWPDLANGMTFYGAQLAFLVKFEDICPPQFKEEVRCAMTLL